MQNTNQIQANQQAQQTVVIYGNVQNMYNGLESRARTSINDDPRPDFIIEMPESEYTRIINSPTKVRVGALKNLVIHGLVASTSFFLTGMVTTYLDIQLVGSGAKSTLTGIAIGSATYGLVLQAAELLKDKIAFKATDKFWDALKELYTGKKEESFEEMMLRKFEEHALKMKKENLINQLQLEEKITEQLQNKERELENRERKLQDQLRISQAYLSSSEETLIQPLLENKSGNYFDYGSIREERIRNKRRFPTRISLNN